jgi:hypothetical protein
MVISRILSEARIVGKEFFPAFVIAVNTFVWYSLIYTVFEGKINSLSITNAEALLIFIIHYCGVAASAILGSMLFTHRRNLFLSLWMFTGIVASLSLIGIESSVPTNTLLIAFFLGASIGIGMPSCLAYFADSTNIENRGSLGGITWGSSGVGILLLALVMASLSPFVTVLILAIWRGIGLVAFILFEEKRTSKTEMIPSFSSILHMKIQILYLIPWIMFCLVNWMEAPIVENLFGDLYAFISFIVFAISGVSALIGGIFCDRVGRKRVIIAGFVILGVAYAILSLLSEIPISRYVYVIFGGIAWGMFAVAFFMVLWGDLGGNMRKEKYYLIGGLPFLLSGFLSILVKPHVKSLPLATTFSLASLFLFLAVLPLLYAPETLPEKEMEKRRLKKYLEDVEKVKKKYEKR